MLLLLVGESHGFATNLIRGYCNREMAESVMMMGQSVKFDDTFIIKLYNEDNNQINSGESFFPGDKYIVKMEPKIHQMVLEVSSGDASFENGFCGGRRTNLNGATLAVSLNASSQNITINGVWATTYSGGVKITSSFSLISAASVENVEEL